MKNKRGRRRTFFHSIESTSALSGVRACILSLHINIGEENEIKNNDVVLFMKGTPVFPMCGFSAATVQILTNLGIKFNGIKSAAGALNTVVITPPERVVSTVKLAPM